MKKTILLIVGLVIVFFIYRGCLIISGFRILQNNQSNLKLDSEVYSKKTPDDYLQLFKNTDKLISDGTDESKRRNPISEFDYNKDFYLQVYKIDTVYKLSLDKIITESFSNADLSPDVEYKEDLNETQFRIRYKEGPKQNVSSIYLSLYGDSTRILKKNDTIAYYYSKFKNFSIRYAVNTSEDVFGNVDDKYNGERTPLELMFLKRKGNLYFILLGAKNSHVKLKPGMLYYLIK